MELKTLADVRDLVDKHLPTQYRHKLTWRHVASQIAKAADGEKDLLEICFSLRLVLALEGVESLMKRRTIGPLRTDRHGVRTSGITGSVVPSPEILSPLVDWQRACLWRARIGRDRAVQDYHSSHLINGRRKLRRGGFLSA